MKYNYYYNNVPNVGQCRNNLIYTSLISEDKKTFVQWYYNDTEYHNGQNQVIDPLLMDEKWSRELQYIYLMSNEYPNLVPKIKQIDLINKKIYLEIDGPDFWEQAGCVTQNYDSVLPDWQDQMLNIIKAHKSLGLYKYSMHPSSYFIVNGKLKSINYFFTYHESEPWFSIKDVESHIYSTRQNILKENVKKMGINWDEPQPFNVLEKLCWQSFKDNYPEDFIQKCLN